MPAAYKKWRKIKLKLSSALLGRPNDGTAGGNTSKSLTKWSEWMMNLTEPEPETEVEA